PPMPKEEEQKLEDLEKKVEQKEEEVKTAPAEKAEEIREEIAEHKEEIAEIKRKYSRSKKSYKQKTDTIDVELYSTGGWTHSLGIRHAAMDALIVAAGFGDREYTGSLKDIMSQDFAEEIDIVRELAGK